MSVAPADESSFLLLWGLSKYDRKKDHKIPIAALQLAVEDLVDRVPVDTIKAHIDQYCKSVQDGFIDFSALYQLWVDSGRPTDLPPQPGAEVRKVYEQWYLGRLNRDQFIAELAKLPEVQDLGGVPPRVVSIVERHQFTHGMSFSMFYAALRGNSSAGSSNNLKAGSDGSAVTMERPRGKKHFEDYIHRAPPPYVHPESASVEGGPRKPYSNTSANLSSVLAGDGGNGGDQDSRIRMGPTTTLLGSELEEDKAHHNRRHFPDSDKVGELFSGQDVTYSAKEDADSPWRGRRHFRGGADQETAEGPFSTSFPGQSTDGAAVPQHRHRGMAADTVQKDNGHIAIGQHVGDFIPKTTQELLWGNMIRRAR